MQRWNVITLAFGLALLAGCGSKTESSKPTSQPTTPGEPIAQKTFALRSETFRNGETIPADFRHTDVGGKNQSPPLEWTDPPSGTRAFALVCVDPDAPGGEFVHWVLYNLPGELRKLERNLGRDATLANGALQGKNDFDEIGYDGPAPPPGKPHRYIFRLFALDRKLDLPPKATREQLEKAMQGHILAQAELIGVYEHK